MMQKLFRVQRILIVAYIATALLAFIYALAFMTEYQNLFGLRLPLNKAVSEFHDQALQSFNRSILAWALGGVGFIALAFFLEAFSTVPDRFALVLLLASLAAVAFGAVSSLARIPALEETYRGLDTTFLEMEGLRGYQLNFLPFTLGRIVYLLQTVSCVCLGCALTASHLCFLRQKKGVRA